MLRKDIIEGASLVMDSLDKANIRDIIEFAMTGQTHKVKDKTELLRSFKTYMINYENFNNAAIKLHELIGLDFLLDFDFWNTIIGSDPEKSSRMSPSHYYLVIFVSDFLIKIVSLLERESDHLNLKSGTVPITGTEKLTIIVLEEKYVSTPERLIIMLQCITGLYESISIIREFNPTDLCVAACDSGSDKSFD